MTKPSSKFDSKPLVVTPGEPAGIGPDLVLQAASEARQRGWVVVADMDVLAQRAQQLGLPVELDDNLDSPSRESGRLTVAHTPLPQPVEAGLLCTANAPAVLETLAFAVRGCLENRFAALVTGPVQKSVMNDAGIPFSGHTEFLQEQGGAPDVVMMLVAGQLRVALATTHLPLRDVADTITQELLERRLRILHDALQQDFAIPSPRILLCGLNPHAGEGGHLGDEEVRVFEPVAQKLVAQGMQLTGPLPADTLFTPERLVQADAVMAAYHDQGLPVLKHVGFGHAVNVTLGLPFVRTSVDHGTALDLAGTGRADVGSFRAAIELADELACGVTR